MASMQTIIKRVIKSANAPKAVGPYSPAIQAGNTLYISGQLGLTPAGEFAGSGVRDQTEQAIKNLGAILETAGCTYQNVVKTTVLLADINDYSDVNEIYSKYFTECPPARAAYAVKDLPKAAKVEIEAIAMVGDIVIQS